MGLDVYAGTLTRYYARNWKTVTQQFAEANGYTFTLVRPDDAAAAPEQPTPAQYQDIAEHWRDAIIAGLQLDPPPLWAEDYDTTPYYTDKPDWEAIDALRLYLAAHYSGADVPATVPKGFSVSEHPIVQAFVEAKEIPVSLFDGGGWWVPVQDPLAFRCALPSGEVATVATTGLLQDELRHYNSFAWNASREEIISWASTEGYPTDIALAPDGGMSEVGEAGVHTEYSTESLAKFAFSILWQAAEFSLKHGTLIILDY